MSKTQEYDKQIVRLLRELADVIEARAKAGNDAPQPTTPQSGVALASLLGVNPQTIRRRAKDRKPLLGYHVEHVSARLFRLVPIPSTKLAQPKEREGERRLRILQQMA